MGTAKVGAWTIVGTGLAVSGGCLAHMLGLGQTDPATTAMMAGAAGSLTVDVVKELTASTLQSLGTSALGKLDAAGASPDVQINHDLHKLAADSMRLALLRAAHESRASLPKPLVVTIETLADKMPKAWLAKVLAGEDVPGPTFNEDLFFELFRAGHATKGATPAVGTVTEWAEFLIEHGTREIKGGLGDTDARTIAGLVRLTYAAATRDTARQDFAESGRGYPALVLRLLSELCQGQQTIAAELRARGQEDRVQLQILGEAIAKAKEIAADVAAGVDAALVARLRPLQDSIDALHPRLIEAVEEDGDKTRGLMEQGFDEVKRVVLDVVTQARPQASREQIGGRHNLAIAGISRNTRFVGRADLIRQIHEVLTTGSTAALTHALSAEGGVGKTETAIAYVLDETYAKTWAGIWWLDASRLDEHRGTGPEPMLGTALPESLRSTLRAMGVAYAPDDPPKQLRERFVRAIQGPERHLVVLDNVDDKALLADFCVPEPSRLLVTTRLRKNALEDLANTIEVDLLGEDDAARLLVLGREDLRDPATGLARAEHADGISQIVRELDGHALALALTSMALRQDRRETPGSVLEKLQNAPVGTPGHLFHSLRDDGSSRPDDVTGRKYFHKVAASLLLLLPRLLKEDPLVGPVLLAASLCHNTGIPPSLLAACVDAETDAVRKTLKRLDTWSILRFDDVGGVEGFGLAGLHGLTQSAVEGREGAEAVGAMAGAVVTALNGVFDDCAMPARWPIQTEALPHARSIFDARPGDTAPVARLLNQVAFLHNALGRAAEAEPLCNETLAMYKRLFEGDHPDVATSLNNLAYVRQVLGRAAEAEPLHEEALSMRRRLFKGDHPDVASSLNNLAYVRQALGRAAEAEPLLEEALAMRRRLFEGDHPNVADSLNNLAFVRQALGRAAEAEPLYDEALAMYRRLFEGDHPLVATSLNNLARVRQALGRAAEAEPLYKEALAMFRRLFKGDHPDVAGSLNNLARVRQALGRAAEAEPLYDEALAMCRRLFQGDHPYVASSLNNLAGVRQALGRAAEAEPVFEEALAMTKRLFKGDHPDVASSLNNLANVRVDLGRAAEAEPLYDEALAMYRRLFEGDHPDVARCLNNLASVRGTLGKWRDALGPSEEAVAMGRRCLPEGHPDLVRWEQKLAFIRERLGRG